MAYARSLVGRDDLAGGTFDDQYTKAGTPAFRRGRGAATGPGTRYRDDDGQVRRVSGTGSSNKDALRAITFRSVQEAES